MSENTAIFWKRVNDLIKEKNTTQEWVCSQTDIKLGTLRGWVTHERFPDAESAHKIAVTLNTTVEFLLTGKTQENTLNKTQTVELLQQTLDKIKSL